MSNAVDELVRLAVAGASLEVAGKSVGELSRIARMLTPGATLRVLDAGAKPAEQLAEIARERPGQVIFRFPG